MQERLGFFYFKPDHMWEGSCYWGGKCGFSGNTWSTKKKIRICQFRLLLFTTFCILKWQFFNCAAKVFGYYYYLKKWSLLTQRCPHVWKSQIINWIKEKEEHYKRKSNESNEAHIGNSFIKLLAVHCLCLNFVFLFI